MSPVNPTAWAWPESVVDRQDAATRKRPPFKAEGALVRGAGRLGVQAVSGGDHGKSQDERAPSRAFNSRYWVFASGLTNVEVTLTVTDTQSGITRTYVNPLNTAFQPIQDTAAFATCPGTVLTVSQVAGTYATAVRLLDNTCGTVTVTPNPTTITAGFGAGRFVLTHAGNSYDGTLQDDGRFTTDPKVLTSGGTQFTIRISGQFSGTGFLAQTTIDQSGAAGSCHYTVEWTGTR